MTDPKVVEEVAKELREKAEKIRRHRNIGSTGLYDEAGFLCPPTSAETEVLIREHRDLGTAAAEAMALVMSHEGVIERLRERVRELEDNADRTLRERVALLEEALDPYADEHEGRGDVGTCESDYKEDFYLCRAAKLLGRECEREG
jgi:hypothetical protein